MSVPMQEFSRYAGGTLTSVVLDRLFQEYRMYEFKETGEMEMDYKTFLDFVLAMEYKSTKQSLRYILFVRIPIDCAA